MAARSKKKWSDLSATQQRTIVVTGAVEAVITAVALWDIVRRPASDVRGPKLAWVLSFVVQPFGPLAYLGAGRRTAGLAQCQEAQAANG